MTFVMVLMKNIVYQDADDDDDDDEQGHGQEACLSDCDVKDCEGRGVDRGAKSGMLTGDPSNTPNNADWTQDSTIWTPYNTLQTSNNKII